MHNQHIGLSQLLATQRSSEHHDHAAQARRAGGARPPRGRRRRAAAARHWWQLARWPAVGTVQPGQPPANQQLIDRRTTMSKPTRALVLVAMVMAMNLAGLTAIAQAQPPDAVEQFRRGERASQEDNTPADAVERFRRGERASQEQTAAEDQTAAGATVRRLLARERSSIPSGTPAQVPAPVQPDQPSGQPTWLVV
jgi:hypothetical protein